MDIDKMFNLAPGASRPGTGSKRKLPDLPPEEVLKRFRPDDNSAANSSQDPDQSTNNAVAAEEDAQKAEANIDEEDDDEEGRFFGGGLNEEQNQILDIFDRAGDDDAESGPMTLPALRRLIGRFERAVIKNAEQRGKYPDDPTKFIESESNLDLVIKEFLPLTQNPALYYPELVGQGTVARLCSLLGHENTDIAIDVIEVLQELTDDDVDSEENEGEDGVDASGEDHSSAARLALAQLVDDLLANSIFELLVSNLARLNEEEDADRQGVFQTLGIMENLLSFMPPLSDTIGQTTPFLDWLLERIRKEGFDSNKQYAAEVLSILLQNSSSNADKVVASDGIETLLVVLSEYRKRDPEDGEESEFMENVFDCLCSIVRLDKHKSAFLAAEGVELMIIMIREKRRARNCAIKALDFAIQNEAGSAGAERFVDKLGLKTLFSAFMGKGDKKKKSLSSLSFEDDERIISIIASLFSNLASDSAPRIRLVAKFIELDYEKLDRLLELRETATRRLRTTEDSIQREQKLLGEDVDGFQEEEWYLRRLDAGLSALQLCDYVIAWVCIEDDGARKHVEKLLARRGEDLSRVIEILKDMIGRMSEGDDDDVAGEIDDPSLSRRKYILQGLVDSLT